ncbi:glycosyl hydrolase family 28-related protein [Carnobacterium maltaromaticum]|uniref:glycosyl hydrolase family 28-related protein n=1 Tax=Carnobacterium maltaromaticum TaxID=2751 RepID=UPI00026C891B|nr:glycosyl hydrolase family 28-related protein [Carnobacterium maltaromaticum]
MNLIQENQRTLEHIFPSYQTSEGKVQVLKETEELFTQFKQQHFLYPIRYQLKKNTFHIKLKRDYSIAPSLEVTSINEVVPVWKYKLDQELMKLEKRTKKVFLSDFGGIADGKTDCTKAFKRAFSIGYRHVILSSGTYLTRGLKIPSNVILAGEGSAETCLKLHPEAPKSEQLLTNKSHFNGNHHIQIKGISLDWNVERLAKGETTATGGIASSGITLAHVKYARIVDVVVKNPGLHGVDITSPAYSYAGDGTRSRLGSQFIWVDQIEAFGFGDDGITTHHSKNILISNCYLHHPSGLAHRTGFSNSNGIEIDDGSEHISLVGNRTAYCFGGVEIKAHETSSAASDTQIFGHFSYRDNRSYNFRHIGHHKDKDLLSQSAYGIRASFLAAYYPQKTDLYKASEPRGIVVSAYQRVVVNQFIAREEPTTNHEKVAIAIQYRARDVRIVNSQLKNYYGAKQPIKISKDTSDIYII